MAQHYPQETIREHLIKAFTDFDSNYGFPIVALHTQGDYNLNQNKSTFHENNSTQVSTFLKSF